VVSFADGVEKTKDVIRVLGSAIPEQIGLLGAMGSIAQKLSGLGLLAESSGSGQGAYLPKQ
jgi:hypothetical protein